MKIKLFACALALAIAAASSAQAADLRATGRATAASVGDAVVRLSVVIKASFGDQESNEKEITREVSGTIIGEDGLMVATLSNIDPASVINRSRGESDEDSKFETTVKSVKLLLRDGREMPATVVSRDRELDLAFLRPVTKPTAKMTAIKLADSAEPQLLEQVFTLSRFGKIANRRIGAQTFEIQGIVENPRTFYIPNPNSEAAAGLLGLPVFNADGKVIGICALNVMAGANDDDNDESAMVTIVPAADVNEIAKQVPEKAAAPAKPEPDKTPAPAGVQTPVPGQ